MSVFGAPPVRRPATSSPRRPSTFLDKAAEDKARPVVAEQHRAAPLADDQTHEHLERFDRRRCGEVFLHRTRHEGPEAEGAPARGADGFARSAEDGGRRKRGRCEHLHRSALGSVEIKGRIEEQLKRRNQGDESPRIRSAGVHREQAGSGAIQRAELQEGRRREHPGPVAAARGEKEGAAEEIAEEK